MAGLTLLAPSRLWLLLPVALLAAGYVLAQARRHKYVVRFTDIELLDTVAPNNPAWRRHVPAVLLLAALLAMALGLTHPARVHAVARRAGVLVLAVDVSPSMLATDVAPSRLTAAKRAVSAGVSTIPASIEVGLVSFAGTAAIEVAPTSDRTPVLRAIDRLAPRSETSLADAVTVSLAAVASAPPSAAGIVMLSDGGNTVGPPIDLAIDQARQDHIPVSTVVLGTPRGSVTLGGKTIRVPVDAPDLRRIANGTGGRFYHAATGATLDGIYRGLAKPLGVDHRRQDIIAWFLAGAFVLALAAATASLLWFTRLP